MRWIIDGHEMLLQNGNEGLEVIPAQAIWENEKSGGACLPALSTVGLYRSRTVASLICRLEVSDESPFGELKLYFQKASGGPACALGASHRSNHLVCGHEWVPADEEQAKEVLDALDALSLQTGRGLSAKEYMACVRNLIDKSWYDQAFSYDAKLWADKSDVIFESKLPGTFTANLADYQVRGSDWLTMMAEQQLGMILGDGMGLGKTVQVIKTICDLLAEKEDGQVLIVCPSALIENWCREFSKFTTGFEIRRHVGTNRTGNFRLIRESVVLTTYDVVARDYAMLGLISWDYLVLDEAQYIKNPSAKRTKTLKEIPKRVGIAVTGTPFENHLTDIWSIVDFCLPGFLGTLSEFEARYGDDEGSARELGMIIRPLLLRRRLCDIPNNLPELQQIEMPIALEEMEAEDYEARKKIYIEEAGALGAISKLKADLSKYCTDPNFISVGKYDYLNTVVDEVISYGEKIIVFAETYASIGVIEHSYSDKLPVFVLTGQVAQEDRQEIIDQFSEVSGSAMLICNPVVGGAGLNITAANHVFHFACQWNPAKIDQADARAHRRGQTAPVTTHYPYYASTIEEFMWDRVQDKRGLSSQVVVGNDGEPDCGDLIGALSLDPTRSKGA